jgi:hypothetical protein
MLSQQSTVRGDPPNHASGGRTLRARLQAGSWGVSELELRAPAAAVNWVVRLRELEDPNVLAVSHHLLTIFESASEIAASRSVAAC